MTPPNEDRRRDQGMVMGYTEDFCCPECASKQWAAVMEMSESFQKVEQLRCVTCKTVWHPCADQGEHQDHDADHTPVEIDAEG
jgi:formate dehydrogenase maturation protein FdhE